MTRTHYQHSLDVLKKNVMEMGEKSHKLVTDSVRALGSRDIGLAEEVIGRDKEIDGYDLKIEKCVSQLIARESPTAGDMRFVTSCFKISLDLERMSDNAVDIAKGTRCLEEGHTQAPENIFRMAELGQEMLRRSMKAFDTLDEKLARATAKEDDKIDRLFYETQRELIEMMSDDKSMINNASYLLFVIRYLERIGDHACNICESVVYMASGERVDLN
ncbi:phosphate signaling complex protein PhoU [Methanolobus chelungpuianus]|uniref:Phosphate-specific transport system accessory protein PhoU n=1 Tax=Methanolobus chelungpuianus TaxID=502115 RepID=A0AAE3H8V3_9EURY|nr:phosphate signaling complex protein PhoU [Methanolobus chelungpuianus]MCQ6961752.1 PhoU family transcriptional regulator [Methanolobus chelungpuianus]